MLSDEQNSRIAPKLRYARIAAAGMIFIIAVLIPVMCQIANWRFSTETPKMLTLIAAFASLMMFTMSIAVPFIFSGNPTSKLSGDAAVDSALGLFMSETFIQLALILGAALMNLVVFSVEYHVASLVLVGIAVLLMLVFFPRSSKARKVIHNKLGQRE